MSLLPFLTALCLVYIILFNILGSDSKETALLVSDVLCNGFILDSFGFLHFAAVN